MALTYIFLLKTLHRYFANVLSVFLISACILVTFYENQMIVKFLFFTSVML